MHGISVLIKGTPESSLAPSTSEDAVRKQLSMNLEEGSHQTLDLLAP